MHISVRLMSSCKRLISAVYGVSKNNARIQPYNHQAEATEEETLQMSVGDDSCFIASSGEHTQVIGIADGVGGWKKEGIDSSVFSKALMSSCVRVATKQLVDLDRPVDILTRAMRETLWMSPQTYGSTTACVLSYDSKRNLLQTANLGDSGFMVIRDNKLVARSIEVTHYFNCPYQLSNPPPGFHLNALADSPSRSSQASIQLLPGDILLTATAGLFNNMYTKEIMEYLTTIKNGSVSDLSEAAVGLVEKAVDYSRDDTYLSPFARNGSTALSWNYIGGKVDDITVILSTVREEDQISQAVYG